MDKLLKDIRYLVSRPEFEALPDEEVKRLYETIRKSVRRDNKYPICQTIRFICYLNGPLPFPALLEWVSQRINFVSVRSPG